MVSMTEYLKNWREEMPGWLKSYHPGDQVAFSDFMSSRVGYYPGCLFDGCLIKTANLAHCVHTFLYVDYGVTRERVECELREKNALLGYHSIGSVEWPIDEILPNGDFQTPSDLKPILKNRTGFFEDNVQPFCLMEIYERNPNKDDSWGSERLAVTYLFADGISTYYQLFVVQFKKAPWLFLLQDHGLGGNYDRFGKDGILHTIIHRYNILPYFVIRDVRSTHMWDGYHLIDNVNHVIGGMHMNPRKLYQRNYKAKSALKEADEKCPFPYIQLDCTIEEFVERTDAISLDDFMKKISDKYWISNDPTECEL